MLAEGVALRDAGIKTPILVLHPQPISFETLIESCLEPSLYSPKILAEFISVAKRLGQKNYPVHLKFNTGFNRLGFSNFDMNLIARELKTEQALEIVSIFSHLAASEDLNEHEFTLRQIDTFEKIALDFENKLGFKPFKHLLNTSGIINYATAQYDMVRSGIGLYGFGNDQKLTNS